jgi:hypothetical protein
LLQEIIAPVLRRSNAKAAVTATLVFIKTSRLSDCRSDFGFP